MEELKKPPINCSVCGKYGAAISNNPCPNWLEAEYKKCVNYLDYLDDRAVRINSYEGKYTKGDII